jgi:hypothetical protein
MERRMDRYDVCIDAYVPGERFDPVMLPSRTDLKASPAELAVAWRRQWQAGQELRVTFLDGDRALHERVTAHAEKWLRFANLDFTVGRFAEAEIRVSFLNRGYWSLVGTDAMRAPRSGPTMQLGGFTAGSDDVQLRRAVLHEFGHAIGCIHEQASPVSSIPWDEPRVYEFYREVHGWDDETIYQNVLMRYSAEETRYSNNDPSSIMQYPVPEHLTRGGFSIGWNTDLSDGDRSFIARMYPGRGVPR